MKSYIFKVSVEEDITERGDPAAHGAASAVLSSE
jgi:hypothetical protein